MTRRIPSPIVAAVLVTLAAAAAAYLGSGRLAHFDWALSAYAVGAFAACFATVHRFAVWAQRPPSRMYFRRGLELWFRRPAPAPRPERGAEPRGTRASPGKSGLLDSARDAAAGDSRAPAIARLRGAGTLGREFARQIVAQDFIRRRSAYRWIMHLCLSGGCTLAFAITFPLVFGWVHFESTAGDAELYEARILGIAAGRFGIHGPASFLLFNALNISAVMVLAGLLMAGARRLTDAGERAIQTFSGDIVPLLMIFAVTATGLALTVCYRFLAGHGHALWAVAHLASVVAFLVYLPFGKLFHVFQRSCALCVARYREAGAAGPRVRCLRCGEDFGSAMHVSDLKTVLDELGFDYRFVGEGGEVHYQDICPVCRRRLLALNQGGSLGR